MPPFESGRTSITARSRFWTVFQPPISGGWDTVLRFMNSDVLHLSNEVTMAQRPLVSGRPPTTDNKPHKVVKVKRVKSRHEEAERWARLCSRLKTPADQLDVDYSGPIRLNLEVLECPLLDGLWEARVAVDEQAVEIDGQWECVCWNSNRHSDYLELQLTAGNLVLERQIFLSASDDFAMLATKVRGATGKRVDLLQRVELAPNLRVNADKATRELRVVAKMHKPQLARVFAVGLPQDRIDSTAGSFASVDGGLEWHQAGSGGALYSPLLIDWSPERRKLPADWRTLTVSEDGQALRTDEASGHRLRIGNHQVLLYSSMKAHETARSVLGYNTRFETLVGLFASGSGEVSQLLAIEQ